MTIQTANQDNIHRAAQLLRDGQLVVMPTETVYGLAGDATNSRAVASIYATKGRPQFNPLISHLPSHERARGHAVFTSQADKLAEAFWPGALTLVLPRREDSPIAELACAGLATVALRVPAHPVAQSLLAAADRPLAAPSANRSGRLSPTQAAHAEDELGDRVALVLDGGACTMGVESTVIALDATGATLLRPGAIARAAIEDLIGPLRAPSSGASPASPGMLESHYAPTARLKLNARAAEPGEKHLAFGGATGDLNLSPSGDLVEAAANLFAFLRALDATGVKTISVSPIPETGLGEAINDRLSRAAIGR